MLIADALQKRQRIGLIGRLFTDKKTHVWKNCSNVLGRIIATGIDEFVSPHPSTQSIGKALAISRQQHLHDIVVATPCLWFVLCISAAGDMALY